VCSGLVCGAGLLASNCDTWMDLCSIAAASSHVHLDSSSGAQHVVGL
jgi:hypothetical protein